MEKYGIWVDDDSEEWLSKNSRIQHRLVMYGVNQAQAFGFVQHMREVDGRERFRVRDESGCWVSVPLVR